LNNKKKSKPELEEKVSKWKAWLVQGKVVKTVKERNKFLSKISHLKSWNWLSVQSVSLLFSQISHWSADLLRVNGWKTMKIFRDPHYWPSLQSQLDGLSWDLELKQSPWLRKKNKLLRCWKYVMK
jgi:hypothetical protein